MHFVDGEVAFDADDARPVPGGDLAIFLPDAPVEGVLFQLKAASFWPVWVSTR